MAPRRRSRHGGENPPDGGGDGDSGPGPEPPENEDCSAKNVAGRLKIQSAAFSAKTTLLDDGLIGDDGMLGGNGLVGDDGLLP